MTPNERLLLEQIERVKAIIQKAKDGDTAAHAELKSEMDRLERMRGDVRTERALRDVHGKQGRPVEGNRKDVADVIRARGGFDTSTAQKIALGSVGQKALMGTPADAQIDFIGLAGYGQDRRFAYTAFPSTALGDALSVDTLVQNARSLAAPGDMDVAIAGAAAKPESTVGLTRSNIDAVMIATVSEPIPNAHWALESVNDFVRSELGYAVALGIDSYLVAQLAGASGTNTRTQGTDTVFDVYRKALGDVRADGHNPDVILVHPNDSTVLDLSRDYNDRYYNSGPQQDGFGSLWGTKVVESNAITEGSPIVVDTKAFGKLLFGGLSWGLNPYSTPTVDLWGTNNAVARLETPMLVAVQRATAICEITLN